MTSVNWNIFSYIGFGFAVLYRIPQILKIYKEITESSDNGGSRKGRGVYGECVHACRTTNAGGDRVAAPHPSGARGAGAQHGIVPKNN